MVCNSTLLYITVGLVFPCVVNARCSTTLTLVPTAILKINTGTLTNFSTAVFVTRGRGTFVAMDAFATSMVGVVNNCFTAGLFKLRKTVVTLTMDFLILCVVEVMELGIVCGVGASVLDIFLKLLVLTMSI